MVVIFFFLIELLILNQNVVTRSSGGATVSGDAVWKHGEMENKCTSMHLRDRDLLTVLQDMVMHFINSLNASIEAF